MTPPMPDDDRAAQLGEHPWWCDCAGCWTGITVNAPKPRSLWRRLLTPDQPAPVKGCGR
jgi:hypothetical protein